MTTRFPSCLVLANEKDGQSANEPPERDYRSALFFASCPSQIR